MRGFKDILPLDSMKFSYVRKIFEAVSAKYGCDLIELPIVEDAELYFRTSGTDSDVCQKELFEVRRYKDEFSNWVLRPEMTASCVRAVCESNFLQERKLARLAYIGPMFRYNRPQKGRYRQFIQAGWEFFGGSGIEYDYELILGAIDFISHFDVKFTLELNNIGTAADRTKYREQLSGFFQDGRDPLRVLDKTEDCSNVPCMKINDEDRKKFDDLCKMLQKSNVCFVHNPYLVRGLDYYNSTVFEIKIDGQAVAGGGRYDYLASKLGYKELPAVGFAFGVDRIVDAMNFKVENDKIAVICLNEANYTARVVENCRNAALNCFVFWGLDLKKALTISSKEAYNFAIIIGENERISNTVQLKNLNTKEQKEIKLEDLSKNFIDNLFRLI